MATKLQQLFRSHKASSLAWLALVCSTGIGWLFGHSAQTGAEFAIAGVIITAFVKVWIIGFQFMELKHAPNWLRNIFNTWVSIVAVVLVIICLK